MSNTHPKRRRILIKKGFQGWLILSALAIILLSGLCSALLVYWLTGDDLHAQSLSAHVSIANIWDRLWLSILIGNVVSIVVVGGVSVVAVLYASHKIAGPLYRFEHLCEQVGHGNLNAITHLREKDQFQELARSFSSMVTKLRDRRDQRARLIAELNRQIDLGIVNGGDSLSAEQQATNAVLVTLVTELEELENEQA